jgi:dephospho-CoA kinase
VTRPVRIGISGPIGCGKSTVAGWLGARPGVVVVDADRIARDVLDPGEPAREAVLERFGPGLVHDGVLDRAALGRLVFGDPAALHDLEAIVHPLVRSRILEAIAEAERAGAAAVVIEAIKLVEGGLAAECDEVWLVTCGRDAQRKRLLERGTAMADADLRVAAQGDLEDRIRNVADRVIDTSRDPVRTRRLAEAALDGALAARGSS